jgi:septal ring-binding cell division protein DamX
MAEAPSRDADASADRWRDKIEVRLDNRQVFFLFFGSAVVACMLFVLGVMVGKRIESRGEAQAPALQDPLAILDRARQTVATAAAPDHDLAFPSTLITPPRPAPPSKTPPAKIAAPKPAAAPKPLPAVVVAEAPKPLAVVAAPKPLAPPAPPASKIGAAPPALKPVPVMTAAAPKPLTPAAPAKGKFTLQLSTFGTAETAHAFAEKYPGAFVIAGDVPGKGMAYRVRYGNFGSFKEATAAKESFERQHNMIALVAAR